MTSDEAACWHRASHTPAPGGLLAWQSWADAMHRRGLRQIQCIGCGLWVIWVGLNPPLDPARVGTECYYEPRPAPTGVPV